jgi:hypothetical protein
VAVLPADGEVLTAERRTGIGLAQGRFTKTAPQFDSGVLAPPFQPFFTSLIESP